MRLHRLEVEAFLAFAEREVVDFDALGEHGLFLLTGRTGAGKTTLLDAVAFALYGDVPGARAGSVLRSDHAAPERLTRVVLEATLRGERVVVTREPDQDRPKVRGTGTTRHAHAVRVVRLELDGSETVLATRHEEAREELQRLLGLSKDQFCQVVLLPQGGFQRFLHAKSDDREKLLRELFDVTRFTRVEGWLKDRRAATIALRDRALAAVHDQLQRADEHAVPVLTGADGPVDLERAVPEADPRDLPATVAWLDARLAEARGAEAGAASTCASAQAAGDLAAETLRAGEALAQRRGEAEAAHERLERYRAKRPERDAAERELVAARRAAGAAALLDALEQRTAAAADGRTAAEVALAALDPEDRAAGSDAAALRTAAARLRRRAGSVAALTDREAALTAGDAEVAELHRAVKEQTALADRQDAAAAAAVAQLPEAVARETAAREAAAQVAHLERERTAAAMRADAAVRRDLLQDRHTALSIAASEAADAHLRATSHQAELATQWAASRAHVMASMLEETGECPVCGSEEHPHPAGAPEGGIVGDADIEAADAERLRLEAARDEAVRARDAVDRELVAARATAGDARADAVADLAAAAIAAHETASALAAGLPAATEAVATLTGGRDRASTDAAAARQAAVAADAQVRARSAALEGDRAAVEAGRAGHPTITAHAAALTARADHLDAAAHAVVGAAGCLQEAAAARARALDAARVAGFAVLADPAAAPAAPWPGAPTPSDPAAAPALLDDPAADRLFGDAAAPPLDEDATLAALAAARRDDASCEALQARLDQYDRGLAEQEALVGREELVAALAAEPPAIIALTEVAAAAAARAEAASRDLAHAQRRVDALGEIREALVAAVAEAEPAVAQCALVCGLCDLAQGTGADNRLRMRLTAYVLAARLEAVAEAASVRLTRMSGGRYTLEHAASGGNGRSRGGLDLKVIDAWTGRERPPASLSGGETFQASLALALGLADVVLAEAGGSRLDTLFIDEGFGSLDDEGSLDEVLDVLDGLRDGGRIVGVVSHVAELRARIPTQLRIEKHRDGSHVRQGGTPVAA